MKSSPGTPSFSLSSFNVQFLLLSIWQRAQVTGEKLHNNSLGWAEEGQSTQGRFSASAPGACVPLCGGVCACFLKSVVPVASTP